MVTHNDNEFILLNSMTSVEKLSITLKQLTSEVIDPPKILLSFKMMPKTTIFTICMILGATVAEPLRIAHNNLDYSEPSSSLDVAARTDISSIIEIICSLVGFKTSAISIAITLIQWAVSNIHVVLLGAASVLGFCKFTGKCNLNYESFIPLSQIQSYATPENLQVAESLFRSAFEKYNEDRSLDL